MWEVVLEIVVYIARNKMRIGVGDTCLVHDGSLLLQCHSDWVLMAISVESYRLHVSRGLIGLTSSIAIPISWPASAIIRHSSGNVSREWPGMNQVVLMLWRSNIFNRRRTPIVPAKRPGVLIS